MKILICRGNVNNAKSYPYWEVLIKLLSGNEIKEITGILSSKEIIDLVNWSDVWVTIDSFLPHLVEFHNLKKGVVIWGKSDPLMFGYPRNTNLLKGRNFLRRNQFEFWKDEPIDNNVFVSPDVVFNGIIVPNSSLQGR